MPPTQTPTTVNRVEAMARLATRANEAGMAKARDPAAPRARQVALAELTPAKMATETNSSSLRGAPMKIGFARGLPADAATLDWQNLPDGRRAAAVSITSPAAKGVRIGVLVRSLPADAILRVYAQTGTTAVELRGADILQALQRNLASGISGDEASTYWLPAVEGAEATLEVALPAGVDIAEVDLSLPQLSHMFALPHDDRTTASDVVSAKIGAAGSCEIDAACNATYQAESNAVAMVVFVKQGTAYQCTGTLLNDNLNSGTPYLLTANHCIPSQTIASTLESYWFYRAPSCGSGTLNQSAAVRTGGAALLYASVDTDTSFLRLNTAPPAGAVFAGWSVGTPALNVAVGGLHHPQNDLLKVSTGTVKSYQNCMATDTGLSCITSQQSGSAFLNAEFTSGTTEAGSSGSPLFQTIGTGRYVVGQLFGGNASCSLRSGSNIYGRFDAAYNTSLKQWLAAPVVPTC